MSLTESQVKKLLEYGGTLQVSQLGFSLLLTRLKGQYKNTPGAVPLKQCTGEINAFLAKFSTIMQKDYEMVTKL
jgi:hypothetical protein